jgi:hypothetical protein
VRFLESTMSITSRLVMVCRAGTEDPSHVVPTVVEHMSGLTVGEGAADTGLAAVWLLTGSALGRMLYRIISGASAPECVPALIKACQAAGWRVVVFPTPTGTRFIDPAEV